MQKEGLKRHLIGRLKEANSPNQQKGGCMMKGLLNEGVDIYEMIDMALEHSGHLLIKERLLEKK